MAPPALSPRELEVLQLLVDGAANPDISGSLYISRRTAEPHVEHILAKLEVTSRTAAVAYALTHELLSRTEPGADCRVSWQPRLLSRASHWAAWVLIGVGLKVD